VKDTVNAPNARTLAVVRTRLPYLDRRALSQAWFSALGLRERELRAVPHALARGAAQTPAAPAFARRPVDAPVPAGQASLRGDARAPLSRKQHVSRSGEDAPGDERTSALDRGKAARAAAPAPASLRYPPVHAAFRLELDGGRVHVVVRREGAQLHVVALCSARHVESVRRALGLAAEHLRLRGEVLAAEVRPFGNSEGAA
jgi:hypothetical protein